MFSALIIGPDPVWRQIVQEVSTESKMVLTHRICDQYPYPYELVRVMNTITPDLVLLDLKDSEKALACAALIRVERPRTVIIGFGSDPLHPIPSKDHGISALLPNELDSAVFVRILEEGFRNARESIQKNLLAFLPSKAGSGASTVVLHTANVLANTCGKKVLVIEADLRSGVLQVFLNSAPGGSIQDALRATTEMDSFKLEQCITRKLGIELLLSNNKSTGPLPAWNQYFELLEFVQGRYDWILVDLPELVNPATAEVVRRANCVFTVCTQEILSLKLAEQRCQELAGKGVTGERLRLILNRWHRSQIASGDVETYLHSPTQAVIPNDYRTFREALYEGKCVPNNSAPGKAFLEFASSLVINPPPDKPHAVLPSQVFSFFRKSRTLVNAPG